MKLRNLRVFEDFNERNAAIDKVCKKYKIYNYTINPDGSIDVNRSVDISQFKLKKLPVVFNRVEGYFNCWGNKLTTLEGCPKYVGGDFNCHDNKLTTLAGFPEYVGKECELQNNLLVSLKGVQNKINGYFNCGNNKLTSLEGGPKEVTGYFECSRNKLTSLLGAPKEVGGNFGCGDNELTSLVGAPSYVGGHDFYYRFNPLPRPIIDNREYANYIVANQDDYAIWNKDGSFNSARFDIMINDREL